MKNTMTYKGYAARVEYSEADGCLVEMMLRMPPELHAKASIAARISGKSLNQWAVDTLKRAVQ